MNADILRFLRRDGDLLRLRAELSRARLRWCRSPAAGCRARPCRPARSCRSTDDRARRRTRVIHACTSHLNGTITSLVANVRLKLMPFERRRLVEGLVDHAVRAHVVQQRIAVADLTAAGRRARRARAACSGTCPDRAPPVRSAPESRTRRGRPSRRRTRSAAPGSRRRQRFVGTLGPPFSVTHFGSPVERHHFRRGGRALELHGRRDGAGGGGSTRLRRARPVAAPSCRHTPSEAVEKPCRSGRLNDVHPPLCAGVGRLT